MKKLALILAVIGLIGSSQAELVLYLSFDTEASDVSGNGNHGTLYGTVAITNAEFMFGGGALNIPDQSSNNGLMGSTDIGLPYGDSPFMLSSLVKASDTKHSIVGWVNSARGENTNLWMQTAMLRDCRTEEGNNDVYLNNGELNLVAGTYDGAEVASDAVYSLGLGVLKSADPAACWAVGKPINKMRV